MRLYDEMARFASASASVQFKLPTIVPSEADPSTVSVSGTVSHDGRLSLASATVTITKAEASVPLVPSATSTARASRRYNATDSRSSGPVDVTAPVASSTEKGTLAVTRRYLMTARWSRSVASINTQKTRSFLPSVIVQLYIGSVNVGALSSTSSTLIVTVTVEFWGGSPWSCATTTTTCRATSSRSSGAVGYISPSSEIVKTPVESTRE
mmetsp:Transcript_24079/g.62826  ORF Transcript_24079/g.62826 Transcript_24079/m.62826 type:complete len:210 (+) Transcript_24079:3666-4295(+)